MVNKDYRKEVGLASPKKNVPRAVAIVVIVAVMGVVSFTVSRVLDETKKHHAAEQAAAAPAPAAAAAAPAQ